MRIYNTLSHKVEEFVPNVPGKVSMYTCGPTVYHFAHIGNLRSYIMEDILEKYMRFLSLGGSKPPLEILKEAGVDLTTDLPFEKAMELFSEAIRELAEE